MKKNKSHIVLAFLLLVNLFFTQVIANFLHDEHCEKNSITHHESGHSHDGHALVSQEECTICSLDLFHEFYCNEIAEFGILNLVEESNFITSVLSTKAAFISSPGRSPPVC